MGVIDNSGFEFQAIFYKACQFGIIVFMVSCHLTFNSRSKDHFQTFFFHISSTFFVIFKIFRIVISYCFIVSLLSPFSLVFIYHLFLAQGALDNYYK